MSGFLDRISAASLAAYSTCMGCLAVLALGMSTGLADAQCPQWLTEIGNPGLQGQVNAIAQLADGDIVVGGDFGAAHDLVRYNPAANSWTSLDIPLRGPQSNLNALLALPNGDLLVGGWFNFTTSTSFDILLRYTAETNAWSSVGSHANNSISVLLLLQNGDVLAAGTINQVGGVSTHDIARYSPSTNTWSGITTVAFPSVTIKALAELPGGDVIVGGSFSSVGGVAAKNIARLNLSTLAWSPLGSGTQSTVYSLAALPGGDVVAGGAFTSAGGVPANKIAKYSFSSNTWSTLGMGTNGSVSAIAMLSNGDLLAGGSFTTAGAAPANRFARYHPANSSWSSPGAGIGGTMVQLLTPLSTGAVVVGGDFSSAGGVPAANIVEYSYSGGPPRIVVQPQSVARCSPNSPITFTVSATDVGSVTYRWRRNHTNLADQQGHLTGTGTATLTVSSPTAADAGDYDCVVSNICGTTISAAATLTMTAQCPSVLYVNSESAAQNDGSSWVNAFRTLTDALNAARVNNNAPEIWVATGTYSGSFDISSGVAIIGGFAGNETSSAQSDPIANPTILASGPHVVTATNTGAGTALVNLTIRDGVGTSADPRGAGVFVTGGSLTLVGCTLTNNNGGVGTSATPPGGGGAICATGGAALELVGCVLTNNHAANGYTSARLNARDGGAIYCADSSLVMQQCQIVNNTAGNGASGQCEVGNPTTPTNGGSGGGIALQNSYATLTECRIESNLSGYGGDAAFCSNGAHGQYGRLEGNGGGVYATGSTLTLSRCTFFKNSARDGYRAYCTADLQAIAGTTAGSGGAIFASSGALSLDDCLIASNIAGSGSAAAPCGSQQAAGGAYGTGAGIQYSGSALSVINCTIASNFNNGGAPGAGLAGAWSGVISNCIFWGNNGPASDAAAQISGGGLSSVRYSCVQSWGTDGIANVSSSPQFADADGPDNVPGTADDDYHLASGSPCIDSGNSADVAATSLTDIAGSPRRLDDLSQPDTGAGTAPIVDRGAYEYALCSTDCNGNGICDAIEIAGGAPDVNGNGVPDECEPCVICIGDYNCDGGVDGSDVQVFFADWVAADPRADVNHDGGVDGTDVQDYFAHWSAGC